MNSKMISVFKPLRLLQVSTIICSMIRTGLSLYLIYLIQRLIDVIIINDSAKIHQLLNHIIIFTIGYLIFIFLTQLSLRQIWFTGHFRLMDAIYQHILKQPLSFFNNNDKGNLLSKITNEAQFISSWYAQGIVVLITQSIVLITTLCLLVKYHLMITIVIVLLITICFIFIKWISKNIAKIYDKDQQMNANINQSILQSFFSIFDIKQLHQETYFQDKVTHQLLTQRLKLNQRLALIFASFVSTSAFIAFIIPIVAIILAAYFVIKHQLSVGAIMAIFSLTKMLDEPIRTISEQINQRQVAHKTIQKLKYLFEGETSTPKQELSALETMKVDIVKNDAIHQSLAVSFDLQPNDVIVIKGNSGVGKTTIANLIQQIIPNSYIEWNGENLATIDQSVIFNRIMRVNQQALLFKGTLQENIIFNAPETDLLNEVMQLCCIEQLKDKFIEDQGNNLSGGEKQRINLARILIQTPDVLILDEVTSALNLELSQKIAHNIIQFAKKYNIALLVISHKDEFDQYANQIIHLQK